MSQQFKSPVDQAETMYKHKPIVLEREFKPDEFDPDNMNDDDINDREKLVNFYLTDMWGYTPEDIANFTDDDIIENSYGILNNINLQNMRKKWNQREIQNHIRKLKGVKTDLSATVGINPNDPNESGIGLNEK